MGMSIFISALIYSIFHTQRFFLSSFRPYWLCTNAGDGYWVGLWKFVVLEQPEAAASPIRFCSIFFLWKVQNILIRVHKFVKYPC